jgi:hypothetical protein
MQRRARIPFEEAKAFRKTRPIPVKRKTRFEIPFMGNVHQIGHC